MDDIAPESNGFQKGLRDASKRFKHFFNDPEVQRELTRLQEHLGDDLDSVREFGIDVPGFDDCPGNLIDLCNVVGIDPHGSDFEELISAVRVYLTRERIQEQIRASINSENGTEKSEQKKDGPFPPDGFRWKGQEYLGLTPLPSRLLGFLWQQPNLSARFEDLAEPVWRDRNRGINSNMVGSCRRDANKFLESNDIPFLVGTEAGFAFLKKNDPGQ